MNLADIRKKAEQNRQSAPVPAEPPEHYAIPSEPAVFDLPVFEESAMADFTEAQAGTPEQLCSCADESTERVSPVPERAVPGATPLPEQPPVSAVAVDTGVPAVHEAVRGTPAVALSPVKTSTQYNALERILEGRDTSAAAADDATLQALAYTAEEVEEYLCFRVAHEGYAISIMAIKEIVKPRDVTEVPRMPAFILGVISLRGVIIPVMDIRIRLSLPLSPTTGKERIIVVKTEAGFCGVLVDEVIQVARIKRSVIEDPPAVLDGIDRDFVTGLGHYDNRMLIILNLAAILDIGVTCQGA